jgi:hypothetical protein
MKALARCYLLAGMWLAATLSSAACQSQGLGDHCDKLNGNADCSSDLICGDSLVCCVPGTPQCLATSTSGTAGAAGSGGSASDAAIESAAGSTNDAEASAPEASAPEASAPEAAPDTGTTATDAADGAVQ